MISYGILKYKHKNNSPVYSVTWVSSSNKTDCHNITEILLKVVLNTITLTLTLKLVIYSKIHVYLQFIVTVQLWVQDRGLWQICWLVVWCLMVDWSQLYMQLLGKKLKALKIKRYNYRKCYPVELRQFNFKWYVKICLSYQYVEPPNFIFFSSKFFHVMNNYTNLYPLVCSYQSKPNPE